MKKKKKDDKHSRGGKTWCNFVWSPHWPCVLSGRGPLITFKFLWAHEKTRHRFDKKWKKKNYGNTKWGEMRLWSSAFWYLVESLCNNLLSSTILSPLNLDSCRPAEKKEVREGIQYAELQCTELKVKNKKQVCHISDILYFTSTFHKGFTPSKRKLLPIRTNTNCSSVVLWWQWSGTKCKENTSSFQCGLITGEDITNYHSTETEENLLNTPSLRNDMGLFVDNSAHLHLLLPPRAHAHTFTHWHIHTRSPPPFCLFCFGQWG